MPRVLKVAAAQVGAVHRWSDRAETIKRLIKLLDDGAARGAELILFPETTLTTFFPRYFIENEEDLSEWFEHGDDITKSANVAAFFERVDELGIDVVIGYGERISDGHSYNTCIYYSTETKSVISKYHKSHLPGTKEPFTEPDAVQQLEKRYFEEGQGGFQAFRIPGLIPNAMKKSTIRSGQEVLDGKGDPICGMLICNDRRWAEAWRVYGLQGVELILCGYNTTAWAPHLHGYTGAHQKSKEEANADANFHHKLVMQSNSYMNSCYSVCAARCGYDDDKYALIGGSCICDPEGHIVAEAKTTEDEIVFAEIDLERCRPGKEKLFNFGKHRRTELYQMIVEQKGVVEPELLD